MARIAVHGLSFVSGIPYTYFDYGDRSFPRAIRQALRAGPPGLVHIDSLDLHRWLPLVEGLPVACTHHSIESDLLRQRAQQERSAILREYMARQADAIERTERRVCPRLSLNVMMSEVDAARLREIAPMARTFVAPNGVDLAMMRPLTHRPSVKGRVAFLGPSYMLPNRDGVEFFLRQIWPIVRERRPDATFQIIGKVADDHRTAFESHPGVSCTGFVPDLRPFLAEAACCVVPLRIGGGTRLKILDAWAMGRPVVSTAVGCEGLKTEDGLNIVVRDTPDGFAAALLEVLGDQQSAERLGARGRQTAETHYSWDAIGASLARAYEEQISHPAKQPESTAVLRGS
jgi:glycosyltransferase involved in cell wall biosynthesis